jgi:hypothetical protein
MSDDLDEEQNEDPTPKQLRDAAKRGKEAEARAEAAERALAFAKAGLDLTDPRVEKYFLPAYDGELDPSKIKEAAQRDGFLTPPEEPPTVTTEEQNAIQRMSRATEGAEAPSQSDYNADLSELKNTAMREHWDPDRFSMEVTKLVDRLGGEVSLDGQPFVPSQY